MTTLPMPAPWRAFIAEIVDVETSSTLYARLKSAYFGRGTRELSPEAVDQWDADQETGRLVITCVNDAEVRASYEILGTHDGNGFLWADASPSVLKSEAATRVRGLLKASGAEPLGGPDRLGLGMRDVSALLAMASEVLAVQNTFLARSRSVAVAMILGDVTVTPAKPEPEAQGLLSRLFGAKKQPRASAEYISPLQMLNQMIQAQVDTHALAPEALVAFDAICADAHADYLAGRFDAALNKIAKGKTQLGQFFIDQEPAGYLIYCEGACLLAKGERDAAHRAFDDAGGALVPPSSSLVRLGLARAATTDAPRRSYLCALYIGSPSWFAEHATEEEAAIVRAAQAEADVARASVPDDAELVLRAAIAERYAQEKRAYALAHEAEQYRKERHVLCDADVAARGKIDAEYRALLLTWFDAPRHPSMGSWSSQPHEDPSALQKLTAREQSDEAAVFEAAYKTPHGSTETYRYKLVRAATPMSAQPVWRIAGVWSVWPGEDIRLL
jgi:hypothetical protein